MLKKRHYLYLDEIEYRVLIRVHSATQKALKSLHFLTKYAIITARE